MSTEAEGPRMDVYGGVRWSAISAYSVQAVQFVISIVLARILVPEDFGLLAMAMVFVGFLGVFRTLGFGQAVIQRKKISDDLLSSLFFVNLAAACLLALGSIGAARLFAWIYGDPRIVAIMSVLSITFLITAPQIIPAALLMRGMNFKRLAVVNIPSTIVGGTVGVSLAVLGWGVWALVCGSLASSAMETTLLYAVSRWRPRLLFRWSEVRRVLSFGANLTGFQVFAHFSRQADKFIIGAFLGATPLGYYSLAYGILLRPRDAVTRIVGRVLFPAFSRMQDDDARLKAAYLRACGAIAFITFPMMLGLLVVARPFVEVVLGAKWLPAVPLICILAPLGAVQSIWVTVGQLFLAKGRAGLYFRWGVAGGILFICSFLAGLPWGVFGVAVSYSVTCLLWTIPSFWLAFRLVAGLRLRNLSRVLLPHVFASGTMALLVCVCRAALESAQASSLLVLSACVPVGILVYAIVALLIRPPALADFSRFFPTSWLRPLRAIRLRMTE